MNISKKNYIPFEPLTEALNRLESFFEVVLDFN
jgi:hypothetical protein